MIKINTITIAYVELENKNMVVNVSSTDESIENHREIFAHLINEIDNEVEGNEDESV